MVANLFTNGCKQLLFVYKWLQTIVICLSMAANSVFFSLTAKNVLFWQVCEEQMCEDQVLPLAISCMDRFLCVCPIKREQLQLLGCACLLLASKLRSASCLPIDLLSAYTDHSVSSEHIQVSQEKIFIFIAAPK